MKLLLISNSTNAGESYLNWPIGVISEFLQHCSNIVFIPYAGVTVTYNDYEEKVTQKFIQAGIAPVQSVHHFSHPEDAVANADAIVVGGGNTFRLLEQVYTNGLFQIIRNKVLQGTPYVGWSAGSNLACPGIYTTNDMPVVEPKSLKAFNLIPFQINPHYLDANPAGHAGETREQRIEEFVALHKNTYVAGLRESCYLEFKNQKLIHQGANSLRLFKYGLPAVEINAGTDISYLMEQA